MAFSVEKRLLYHNSRLVQPSVQFISHLQLIEFGVEAWCLHENYLVFKRCFRAFAVTDSDLTFHVLDIACIRGETMSDR
jgi:hypothetical protein